MWVSLIWSPDWLVHRHVTCSKRPLSNLLRRSHWHDRKSEAMLGSVCMVSSGGRKQRQQLVVQRLGMHYNNKGNLEVNKRRMYHFNKAVTNSRPKIWYWNHIYNAKLFHICIRNLLSVKQCFANISNSETNSTHSAQMLLYHLHCLSISSCNNDKQSSVGKGSFNVIIP